MITAKRNYLNPLMNMLYQIATGLSHICTLRTLSPYIATVLTPMGKEFGNNNNVL